MESGIYKGWLRHRRHYPKKHILRYQVFMMLIDLSELDQVFEGSRLWSQGGKALAEFRRSDYLGDPTLPLDIAVRQRVQQKTGVWPEGAIRLLTNCRYFGFVINPISCYYCFNRQGQLQFIVAEVNNTPWDERYSYVLECDPNRRFQRIGFNKDFHVSPFNPMDIHYDWRSSLPEQCLRINMQNWRCIESERMLEFDATLVLEREEISPQSLRQIIVQYPFMTLKVIAAIYWQAMKLLLKGVPLFSHPERTVTTAARD